MQMVFDPLRRKEVAYTPEESVRQQLIKWLHGDRGVPISLMASEYSFSFNRMNFRADVVVFDRKASPLLVVECKAPGVKLDKDVIEQVVRYNIVLRTRYLMITNGERSLFLIYNKEDQKYNFADSLPEYNEMIDECSE